MSEKILGVIGQKYEDRRTGNTGVLESRDDKYKTLLFKADDGSTFSISNSSFRSNWRKVRAEEVNTETEDVKSTTTSETATETIENGEAYCEECDATPEDGFSESAIESFVKYIEADRKIKVDTTDNILDVYIDDIHVIRINKLSNFIYKLIMLPDVYSFSDIQDFADKSIKTKFAVKFNDSLYVSLTTNQTSLNAILNAIKDIAKEINVYGYIKED